MSETDLDPTSGMPKAPDGCHWKVSPIYDRCWHYDVGLKVSLVRVEEYPAWEVVQRTVAKRWPRKPVVEQVIVDHPGETRRKVTVVRGLEVHYADCRGDIHKAVRDAARCILATEQAIGTFPPKVLPMKGLGDG